MATQLTLNDGSLNSAGALALKTNGTTQAINITTGQQVEFNDGSDSAPSITNTGDTNTGVFFPAADTVGITTGGTERARVDSSGNLGLGVTPSAWGTSGSTKAVQVSTLTSVYEAFGGSNFASNTYFNGSADTYITSDWAGKFAFDSTSGLFAWYRGASGTAGNAITFTQAMTLDASGNLLVGTTSANGRIAGQSSTATNGSYAFYLTNSATTTLFYVRGDGLVMTGSASSSPYNNTTASAANVYVDSSGFLLRSTSSIKYKTDVQDATHGLAEVMQLRPVTYKGKKDGDKVFGGLIAEEVHEAGLTEFVQYADDGSPDALAYGNMVSLCIKAIQEMKTIIDQQAERIAALEAK